MMWVFAIVVVVVLGGVAVVAAGRGEPMAPAYDDRPDALVPAGRPLTGADLRRVRFSVALRGYRMSEVDALLARLGAELDGATRADTTGESGPSAAPGLVDPAAAEEHDPSCP
jgi:DivIVA domain-containing protein